MKETIEQLVESERFNMNALESGVWPLIEAHQSLSKPLSSLSRRFTARQYKHLKNAILRHVFLIELVKIPTIDSTKFRVRWYSQLRDDPRECSFEECLEIAEDLLNSLVLWLEVEQHRDFLELFFTNSILPYEMPIDYHEVPTRADFTTRIHRRGNIEWAYDEIMLRTMKLRKYLTDKATSPDPEFFKKVIEDKINVKTYLTDRSLTGAHKTNREKRWETHPHSVQFATRRAAMAIEYTLVTQICDFENFPDDMRARLANEGILPSEHKIFRCPVTLEPMSFPLFKDKLINPTHGKSEFQVAHLNPLKLDDPASDVSGHTADNISWISADGNRIQGSLSLSRVRELMRKIAANYEELGIV